jgi:hypothetical protein
MSVDRNVASVMFQLAKRAEAGLAKYGTTTEREDISLDGWLQHLQEELMDATIYIEQLKNVHTENNTRQSTKVFQTIVSDLQRSKSRPTTLFTD